jgi:ribosome-binding factor A
MVAKSRLTRIGDRIREELSDLLLRYVQDPRLSSVSITDVKVDRELSFADVYFSSLEGQARSAEIKSAFYHAQGFLRTELASRIDLRTFPRLRFHWDPTFEKAERIEQLLASIREQTPSSPETAPEAEDDTHDG